MSGISNSVIRWWPIALAVVLALLLSGTARAATSFQPQLGVPASNVQVIGASPGEAPGEAWAQGTLGAVPATSATGTPAGSEALLRYTAATGSWQVVPVDAGDGTPLGFTWWGSEVTSGGGVVLAGGVEKTATGQVPASAETLVTREPGGSFAVAPLPASSGPTAVLAPEEAIFPTATSPARSTTAPIYAALAEGNGATGALVAPVWSEKAVAAGELGAPGILHFDGTAWSREPICGALEAGGCVGAEASLRPLALAASGPGEAFLLASTAGGGLKLFQRVRIGGVTPALTTPAWVPVTFSTGLLAAGGAPFGEAVAAAAGGPLLTVTNQGAWVDLALSSGIAAGNATVLVAGAQGEAPLGADAGTVLGTWCYPVSLCPEGTPSLGAALPTDYGSFAWPGSGASPGTRVISGLPNGALLELSEGGSFSYVVGGGAGGAGGAIGPGGVTLGVLPGSVSSRIGGAAFESPTGGWLGGALPLLHVTTAPRADQLTAWPVPFRRPLLAAATEPGTTAGAAGAEALAVGAEGEVARYRPGQGWEGEYLYNSGGERQTPNLRGVAWPEHERAYAVGDNGAMWVWQADTEAWEPDPAAPLGFRGQLTAVAFSPGRPEVGYAVGKQGVLLAYGKTWTQEALPEGLANANFTSVAFAGGEAIATYRLPLPTAQNPYEEVGGLIVDEGSGWHRDPEADRLLAQVPAGDTILSRVAGLPDGGAVAAGPGLVIERDGGPGSAWRFSGSPLPEAGDVSALAAFREGASVRALVSVAVGGANAWGQIDNPPSPAQGEYGSLLPADPLPTTGYVLRETANGWHDEEGEAYPVLEGSRDLPGWPDPVLALLVEPGGGSGWALGGETGNAYYRVNFGQAQIQTASVARFGSGSAPPQQGEAPLTAPSGTASFALGGDAQCESACADFANLRLGADTWLTTAIARAGQVSGLRGFLYAGQRLPTGASGQGESSFERELARYGELLGGGSLPVYAASSPSDASATGLGAFTAALGGHVPAGTVPPGTPAPPHGEASYAFESTGTGGKARVIVLDYSGSALAAGDTSVSGCATNPALPANQLQWLCSQLYYAQQAEVPAIVLGNANLSAPGAAGYATDAAAVDRVLLSGGASAYLFDSPGRNVSQQIGSGAEAIPAYGTGTLGYVPYPLNGSKEFFGADGFLLVSVATANRNAATNRAPVSATLIPNVGKLGVEATNGTLLRRSSVGLFSGLARIPEAGSALEYEGLGNVNRLYPEPYVPIPESCLGSGCSQFIGPQYTFTSSDPEVGDFVEADPNSTNARTVRQVGGRPVADSASGLFCAYNAGTTTVTLTAGGLSTSMKVTVEPGSVAQPCGTVPLKNPPAATQTPEAATGEVPPASPAPAPAPTPAPTVPAVPVAKSTPPTTPTPPTPKRAPAPPVPAPPPVLPLLTPTPIPPRAVVPPPSPQPPEPTPPSGTSQVTQPVGITEEEKEEEPAIEAAHGFVAHRHGDPGRLIPGLTLILVLAIVGAGVGIGKQRRRRQPSWALSEGSYRARKR